MKNAVHIILLVISPHFTFAQYYLKGEVKDEKGAELQNASIRLKSTGYIYYSGSGGSFGISTNIKSDTVTVVHDGYIKQTVTSDAAKYLVIVLKKAPQQAGKKLSSVTLNLPRSIQQEWITDEAYANTIENRFIKAGDYPATSISLNEDRASYSNIRKFINVGNTVPPEAVRIEEMINYFNLDYVKPSNNKDFEINSVLTSCPWNAENQLVFFRITSKKLSAENLLPCHFVFLIDVSASMDMPARLPLIKDALKALVNNIRAKDSVSIVVYGGTTGIVLQPTGGNESQRIIKTIDSLRASGNTPGASGISLAYGLAHNHFIKGGNNRIILATDGDFNVGSKSEEELKALVTKESQSGVYLSCLGMGMGNYQDAKIQTLAQWGNGNFAYLDSYAEAEKVLLKEFSQNLYAIADNATLKVKFNPEYVRNYRLIGYDNKVGAIKDTMSVFEGGTLGPGYTSLIAFELTPANPNTINKKSKAIPVANLSLKYNLPGSKSFITEEYNSEIMFTPTDSTQASYRFATAVIMFGSLLRNSPYVTGVSWSDITKMATGSKDNNNFPQQEFVSIVQQAKMLYGKKRK